MCGPAADTQTMKLAMPAGRGALAAVLVIALVAVAALMISHRGNSTATVPGSVSASEPAAATPTRGAGAGEASVRSLRGAAFTSSFPSSWNIWSRSGARADLYQLSSTHGRPNELGIPPAGAIAITIDASTSTSAATARFSHTVTRDGIVRLMPLFVGTPGGAVGVSLASPPKRSKLAGSEAAIEAYGYTYRGVGNIQVDVLAKHDAHIVLIELDTEPQFAAQGEAALETLARHWHWR
jgi:hypothetical protein